MMKRRLLTLIFTCLCFKKSLLIEIITIEYLLRGALGFLVKLRFWLFFILVLAFTPEVFSFAVLVLIVLCGFFSFLATGFWFS